MLKQLRSTKGITIRPVDKSNMVVLDRIKNTEKLHSIVQDEREIEKDRQYNDWTLEENSLTFKHIVINQYIRSSNR